MFSDSCPFHDFDKVHEIGDFSSSKTRITRKNTSGKISGLLKLFSMIFYVKSRELILTRPSPITVKRSILIYIYFLSDTDTEYLFNVVYVKHDTTYALYSF